MKYILFIPIIFFAFLMSPLYIVAQEEATEPTQEPAIEQTVQEETTTEENDTSEEAAIKQKILDLKERLATRVAEIQEQNKRAFFGVVKETSDKKYTLLFDDEEQLVAASTDISVYSKDGTDDKESSTLDTLSLGQSVSFFGTLDLDQKTLIADYAITQELPKKMHGSVTEVDTDENTLTVNGSSGVTILDYEISTRCTLYENETIDTCGLSQIQPGDLVFVRMTPEDDDLSSATALRILLIPSNEPETEEPTPDTEETTDSTTSDTSN